MRSRPAGTVTFVFTDIVGSTRLVRRLGRAYHRLLLEHRVVIRAALAEHGGIEVRTEGDAFFAVFTEAGAAVEACLDAQRRIAAHPWPDDGVIAVRMGARMPAVPSG